jgi:hypothetical protein
MATIQSIIDIINANLPDTAGTGSVPKISTAKHREIDIALSTELAERGIYFTTAVGNVAALDPANFKMALVDNVGFYIFRANSVATPNGTTVLNATGGKWLLQQFPSQPIVVVELADAATINMASTDGDVFNVTFTNSNGANRTIAKPTNPIAGRKLSLNVTHGIGAPFNITWDAAFKFPINFPQQSSSVQGARDKFTFEYSSITDTWDCIFLGANY